MMLGPEPETPEEGRTVPTVPLDHAQGAVELASSILPTPIRNGIYISYGVSGIILGTTTAAMTAMEVLAPTWLIGALAAYGFLGTFVGILAKANTKS